MVINQWYIEVMTRNNYLMLSEGIVVEINTRLKKIKNNPFFSQQLVLSAQTKNETSKGGTKSSSRSPFEIRTMVCCIINVLILLRGLSLGERDERERLEPVWRALSCDDDKGVKITTQTGPLLEWFPIQERPEEQTYLNCDDLISSPIPKWCTSKFRTALQQRLRAIESDWGN